MFLNLLKSLFRHFFPNGSHTHEILKSQMYYILVYVLFIYLYFKHKRVRVFFLPPPSGINSCPLEDNITEGYFLERTFLNSYSGSLECRFSRLFLVLFVQVFLEISEMLLHLLKMFTVTCHLNNLKEKQKYFLIKALKKFNHV